MNITDDQIENIIIGGIDTVSHDKLIKIAHYLLKSLLYSIGDEPIAVKAKRAAIFSTISRYTLEDVSNESN